MVGRVEGDVVGIRLGARVGGLVGAYGQNLHKDRYTQKWALNVHVIYIERRAICDHPVSSRQHVQIGTTRKCLNMLDGL